MPAPAAILATFHTLRHVPSRKVCQIVFEVPHEKMAEVLAVLGAPDPASPQWVGIARVDPKAAAKAEPAPKPDRERKPWHELSRAQQAGIRCGEAAFTQFLTETGRADGFVGDETATVVRSICDVKTRSDLDKYEHAAVRWDRLDREYRAWLDAPKYGAA